MGKLLRTLMLVGAATLSTAAFAQTGLPPHCLVSMSVKDKGYSLGAQTLSCRLTEQRRAELFARVEALKDTGEIDGAELAAQLSSLEKKLDSEANSKNWGGLISAVTGNTLATIGLAACLETVGGGCALAVVGKVLSSLDVIGTTSADVEKAAKAKELRDAIARIRVANQHKKSPAKAMRGRMIAEFTQLCQAVRTHCL